MLSTNTNEISDFITLNLFFIVSLLGILPCYLYYFFKKKGGGVSYSINIRQLLLYKMALIFFTIFFGLTIIFLNFTDFLIIRQNKELFEYIPPYNYIKAIIETIKYSFNENDKNDNNIIKERGKNINNIKSNSSTINLITKNKNLIVFIIGESTRSKSINWNGYENNTMEFLDPYRENIINFQNWYSCNTSTFNSIPCIFSYSPNLSLANMLKSENLIDILKEVNFNLQLKTNNSGCKMCATIENIVEVETDEELIENLKDDIANLKAKNNVIFLHFRGSHGTEYYKRYPQEYEKWSPSCKEKELRKCNKESIINSYNNSIRYNMKLVADTIKTLQEEKNINTALFFVSDHGEAIGDNGFYLHATPLIFTKESVGKVASFMWFSNNFLKELQLNKQCMQDKETEKLTHFNIFHTTLNILKIKNENYNENLDIFKLCK
jgi:lipid A ethanolaminephosphotransferase